MGINDRACRRAAGNRTICLRLNWGGEDWKLHFLSIWASPSSFPFTSASKSNSQIARFTFKKNKKRKTAKVPFTLIQWKLMSLGKEQLVLHLWNYPYLHVPVDAAAQTLTSHVLRFLPWVSNNRIWIFTVSVINNTVRAFICKVLQ